MVKREIIVHKALWSHEGLVSSVLKDSTKSIGTTLVERSSFVSELAHKVKLRRYQNSMSMAGSSHKIRRASTLVLSRATGTST